MRKYKKRSVLRILVNPFYSAPMYAKRRKKLTPKS